MADRKHILFAGGGTVGHIAPLLAVAEAVHTLDKDVRMSYIGTTADLNLPVLHDSPFVEANLECYTIPAGKLNRYLTLKHLKESTRFIRGVLESRKIVRALNPDCVFAKGGYATVPVVLAARRLGIPVYCHESDVVPGLANRIVSRKAELVFTSYPKRYYKDLPREKVRYVGQPVRQEFFTTPLSKTLSIDGRKLDPKLPLVTIIGGSQGAHRLNELASESWPELLTVAQVIHITGTRDYPEMVEKKDLLNAQLKGRLWIMSFLGKELPEVFKHSTLLISRAGGTIAEIAATEKPSVLVPLSTSAQNHQEANARVLREHGAAMVFDEVEGTARTFSTRVLSLLKNEELLTKISQAVREFSHPEAAEEIATTILGAISKR